MLFGGHRTGAELSDETWIWDGDARTWIQQTPSVSPPRRYYAQMAWDYSRRRLVLYGGLDDTGIGSLSDVWEWDGATWTVVPTLGAPRRDGFGITPGDDGGVTIFAGETFGLGSTDNVFRLRHDAPALYETCTSADVDGDGKAGCADADCASSCIPCGDGTCDPQLETCASCPGDCGACPTTCGDGLCQMNETCPGDC
jgi:hypothetical protein